LLRLCIDQDDDDDDGDDDDVQVAIVQHQSGDQDAWCRVSSTGRWTSSSYSGITFRTLH